MTHVNSKCFYRYVAETLPPNIVLAEAWDVMAPGAGRAALRELYPDMFKGGDDKYVALVDRKKGNLQQKARL